MFKTINTKRFLNKVKNFDFIYLIYRDLSMILDKQIAYIEVPFFLESKLSLDGENILNVLSEETKEKVNYYGPSHIFQDKSVLGVYCNGITEVTEVADELTSLS